MATNLAAESFKCRSKSRSSWHTAAPAPTALRACRALKVLHLPLLSPASEVKTSQLTSFHLLIFSHSAISYVRCLFNVPLYLCRFCVRTYMFINVVLISANSGFTLSAPCFVITRPSSLPLHILVNMRFIYTKNFQAKVWHNWHNTAQSAVRIVQNL